VAGRRPQSWIRFWSRATPLAIPQRSKPPPIEMQIPAWWFVISDRRIVILVPLIRTFGMRDERITRCDRTTSCAVREMLTSPSIAAWEPGALVSR
jgi:hypothetical protein